jgi:hypothetical protein
VAQHRNLHHHKPVDFLHLGSDPAEDMGMCDRLQSSEFLRAVEDDGGESGAVDLTGFDNLRPSPRHLGEGRAIRAQDLMPDGVGVDRVKALSFEKTPHLALPRRQAAAQNPSALLSTHRRGR